MKKFYFTSEKNSIAHFISVHCWRVMVFAIVFLMPLFSFGQQDIITTTGASTWTVPCGVTSITVEAWGAGGAGGGSTANDVKGGGGGAGGSYVSSTFSGLSGGQTFNLYVANTTTGANSAGAAGEGSWFNANNILYAQGGAGGAAPNNTTVPGGVGSIASSIGTVKIAGSNGIDGTTTTGNSGGAGGNSGGAGGGTRTAENNGQNGTAPGGGGGGAFLTDGTDHSGGSGGSGKIIITYTSSFQNYCTPTYTNIRPITNVTFAGINKTTTATIDTGSGYESYCDVATVIQGSVTNAISIKANTNGNQTYYFRIYIDWDQNGTFGNNTNEIYDLSTLNNSTGIDAKLVTGNIAIPVTASLGLTRMRVMSRINNPPTACSTIDYGQTEDYTVNVIAIPTISIFTASPSCSNSGASVVITGTNFTGATAVNFFNGVSASFTVNSATQITATLPASATTGVIKVTTPGGTATSATNFTVNTLSIAPTGATGTTTICNGGSTTLTVAGGSKGTAAVTQWYTGSCGTGLLVFTGDALNTGVLNTNTTYYVRYSGTCNTTSCATVNVTVNALPVAGTLTPLPAASAVCIGSSVSATATAGSGGSGTITDELEVSLSSGSYTAYTSGTSISTTGQTSVSIRTRRTATGSGCTASGYNTVSWAVNPLPTVFSVTGTGSYCSGGSGLAVGLSGSETGVNYQLYNGATPVGSPVAGTGSAISFGLQTIAATYTVTATNATTTCGRAMTGNAVITITPTVGTPTAITVSVGSQPSCQLTNGTTTTTYATTATNNTGFNWSLSNGAAGIIGATTGVMTWANGFSGTVDIQVTANGCNGPSLQVIRTVNITPTVGTPTAISVSAGTEPICQLTNGTTTTTYATTATNSTGYNWSLSNGSAGSIGATTGVMTWANGFSGTVDIRATASGCNGASSQVIRTVTITPTVGTPTAITISAGTQPTCQLTNGTTTTSYTTTATNNTGYNWSLSNGAAGSIDATTGVMTWANGFSGTVNIQVTANGCNGPTSPVVIRTVTIYEIPVVTTQPMVLQAICATNSVSFTVVAKGGGLSYQWYKGVSMLSNGGAISGANTATLTINPLVTSDTATNYYCVVSNICGSVNSNNAELIVNEMPVIPNQVISVCSDDVFSFAPTNGVPTAATIVPAGTTYSWSAPTVTGGITGGTAGSNQATINATLNNPSTLDQTATYTLTPKSGTTGSCVGNTFTVVVTVKPSPSILNINAAICSGEALTVTPVAGGGNIVPPGTTYSWGLPSVTGGITGATVASGQSSFNQTLINPTNTSQIATYTVTASYGGCTDNTFSIFVTVNPKPTSAGSVATQSICSGSSIAPITISNPNGVSGTITYSWTRNNTTNITGIPNGSGAVITGALTNTTNTQQTTTFSLYASSSDGCISLPSTVTVVVDPVPTVAATPNSQTICSENGIGTINISNPNSVAGTTFSWTRNNTTNITGIPSGGTIASITGNLTNTTNTVQTTTFTVNAVNSCNSPTTSVSVTVNPKPTVAVSVASQTVCGGFPFTNINITNPNNVSGTTFSWTRDNTTNLTGVANNGSGSVISGTFVNNTNSIQLVTFTITASASGCPSTNTTTTVTVNPTPLLVISPATPAAICNVTAMATLTLTNTNNVAGTVYTWTRDKTTEITGIAASGSGSTISGTLTNTTAVTQTTIFTVTATAPNGCFSTKTVSVSVYAPLTTPVVTADQTVCTLSTPAMLTSTVPTGGSGVYTYQWQSSANAAGPWTNIGGATNSTYQPAFVNLGDTNKYYQLITYNVCGNTTSNVILIQIVNNVGFTFNTSGFPAGSICPGTTFTPSINAVHAEDSAVRYSWTANSTYVTPAVGGPIGTTGDRFWLFVWLRTSSADFSYTVQNNTNASVITPISITPSVYDYPGPPTGALLCSITPQIRNITILPTPVATATVPNNTICSGSSAGITVSGNITDATMTFAWSRNNSANVSGTTSGTSGAIAAGGTFVISNALTNTSAASQSVIYTITPSSNGCNGTPITVTITVASPLTPGTVVANQTICSGGDPAAFTETVAATGTGLSYQWQSSTTSATGPWANIGSAIAAVYDAPSGLTQTTWYQRVVTSTLNGVTCAVANAVPIQVTVNTINPGSVTANQTICSGGNPVVFGSVAATGAGVITYQWQSNTTGCGGSWSDIGGATFATYDVPTGLLVTTYYRRIAISTLSGKACSDYSNCITVSVNDVTAGTINGDQTICGTTPTAFTVSTAATGTGVITYQWESNTTGCGGVWNTISGATAATYAPSGLSGTTYYHRITISTLNGVACTAIGNCITVTVNSVTGGVIASNRTVCNGGDPAAFTVTTAATGTALTYQWQMSTTSGIGPWSPIAFATGATYDAPSVSQTTYYQRIVYSTINAVTCSAVSNSVTVFVNDVTASVIAGSQSVCGSADPVAFTVSTSATGLGALSYQWQRNTTGCAGVWSNIGGATSATYDAGPVTQTTYYQVVVTSTLNAVQCTAPSNCVMVTYNPNLPASVSISESANSICTGTSVTFIATPTNGGATPIYQWKLNGGNVGVNSTTYTNATLVNGDVVTCVMTSNATCATGSPATSNAVTMVVTPSLLSVFVTLNGAPTICLTGTGTTLDVIETVGVSIASRQWGTRAVSGGAITPIGGQTATTLTAGTGLAVGTWIVVCTSTSTCGVSVVSNEITVTIDPQLSAPTIGTITQPNCVTLTGSVVLSGLPASGIINQTGTVTASYTVTGTTMTISGLVAGTYNFSVSNGACTSAATGNVVINPVVTTTWTAGSWNNGIPTSNSLVIINGTYNTSTYGDINACSLIINTGFKLTITAGKFVIIQNNLTVNGTLDVLDQGSLVMVNDMGTVTNNGTTDIHRFTTLFKKYDYTYWSTPVVSTNIASTFSGWNTGYSYEYLPANFFDGNGDGLDDDENDWSFASTMTPANGYIIMVPDPVSGPFGNNPSEVVFNGRVNNGVQKVTGVIPDSSYLLGNPYPSALDAEAFLDYNAGVIDGTLYFWTHNTAIQLASDITNGTAGSGAYAFTSDDYASYNAVGGVGVGSGSAAVSGGTIPSGKIASTQGFFASTNVSIVGTNEIVFNNAMRLGSGGTTLDNSQFFKTKSPKAKTTNAIEKHRIWLDLFNSKGAFKQTLIGYVTGATNDIDRRFDGESYDGNEFIDFYSVNQDKNLVIQGRALPFDENDQVPLGYTTIIDGTFSIKIEQSDGLLSNQAVFLEDKLTSTVFDLKSGNYTFNTAIGTFNDRFVLKYKPSEKSLGNAVFDILENKVLVSVKNKLIKINSFAETIDKVVIYDSAGRKIYEKDNVNSNELSMIDFVSGHQALIVKTTLKNGNTVTDKIIF